MLLGDHPCSLDYIHLDGNRVTTEAALWLIRTLQKRQAFDNKIPELTLYGNPIGRLRPGQGLQLLMRVFVCELMHARCRSMQSLPRTGKIPGRRIFVDLLNF